MQNNDFNKYLLCWQGSKRLLRKYIVPCIPSDIDSYIEPFGGSAAILFAKNKYAPLEVYNDIDSLLVNLFRIVKYHKNALIEEMAGLFASREQFQEYMMFPGETDIQKAARFLFTVTRSFGGLRDAFGTKTVSGVTSAQNLLERIPDITRRLDKVIIENLTFERVFEIYDREKAFFYCDPPYTIGHGYSTVSTAKFNHQLLADILKQIKARFCLSYDDTEKVRNLYKDFNIIELTRKTTPATYQAIHKNFKELLITNYDITCISDNNTQLVDPLKSPLFKGLSS